MARFCLLVVLSGATAVAALSQLPVRDQSTLPTRRSLLRGAPAAIATASGLTSRKALAADDLVQIYFGVGCFWHVQHEFVEAERRILGRSDGELTARAGYAGGRKAGKDASRPGQALVCYHNLARIADYGKLGHSEVVGLSVPAASVGAFAKEYAKLFDERGDRPDKGDKGGEYRSLIGLPGGFRDSPLLSAINDAVKAKGLTLAKGNGDDSDTLGLAKVWVYDTADFPFYQAEVYHQFHDGFMKGEQYGKAYNDLRMRAYNAGRLGDTGCPDIV